MKRYRHENEDMNGIAFLFEQVECGKMSADDAMDSFARAFGGYYVYVEKKRFSKKARITELLEGGKTATEAWNIVGGSRSYVCKVRREINKTQKQEN